MSKETIIGVWVEQEPFGKGRGKYFWCAEWHYHGDINSPGTTFHLLSEDKAEFVCCSESPYFENSADARADVDRVLKESGARSVSESFKAE